jgi:lipoprotein-anchoring transpeptidase ErfK/SrfK
MKSLHAFTHHQRLLLAAVMLAAVFAVAAAVTPPAFAAPATLSIGATPPVSVAGTQVELAGVLADAAGLPLAGAPLTLSARRYDEAAFQPVVSEAPLVSGADGSFLVLVRAEASTTYRVEYGGDALNDPAAAELLLRVRPRITTRFPKELWQGETATLKGAVWPAHPGSTVTIERKVAGVWRTHEVVTLDAASAFTTRWRPDGYGFKYVRVTMAADEGHAVMVTPSRRLVVNRANKHHIRMVHPHYIVIDHSEFHLYYYEHGRVVKKWDCVLGKPSTPTPLGHFRIYGKWPNPGGGMGPYYLGYYGAIGIHGTSEPWLIGRFPRAFSHGCARLYDSQITWLYPRVPVGTPVWNIR